ncbi:hypothetical protein BV25DRAFT_1842470 [Artomyces pyxidatus]|uniref:Uncharacterized protein n=1 Tax=Artomyces pyxidatus TaxID=48021 RepID=A0ACB8SIY4_9AGAM|nr:hypothetical protein BV25DRAFT_1842470 [Artomyces pyxidatus]
MSTLREDSNGRRRRNHRRSMSTTISKWLAHHPPTAPGEKRQAQSWVGKERGASRAAGQPTASQAWWRRGSLKWRDASSNLAHGEEAYQRQGNDMGHEQKVLRPGVGLPGDLSDGGEAVKEEKACGEERDRDCNSSSMAKEISRCIAGGLQLWLRASTTLNWDNAAGNVEVELLGIGESLAAAASSTDMIHGRFLDRAFLVFVRSFSLRHPTPNAYRIYSAPNFPSPIEDPMVFHDTEALGTAVGTR